MIDGYEDKGFRTVELKGVKTSKRMTSFELELLGEIDRLRSENAVLNGCIKVLADQNNNLLSDQDRLDFIEERVHQSRNGVSLDYAKYVEDGEVIERGFRFISKGFLGDRKDNLRQAIDSVRGVV